MIKKMKDLLQLQKEGIRNRIEVSSFYNKFDSNDNKFYFCFIDEVDPSQPHVQVILYFKKFNIKLKFLKKIIIKYKLKLKVVSFFNLIER